MATKTDKADGKAKPDEDQQSPGDGLVIGRQVHYVLGPNGAGHVNAGQCRTATVVRTWGANEPWPIQLAVFLDGSNDDPLDGAVVSHRASVPHSSGNEQGRWHWPRECAAEDVGAADSRAAQRQA